MKRIVIVGAGFAGLAAAKALRHSDAEVFVVDRANHDLFQPLLYQVATTVLSPAQIASPIRELLKNRRNATEIPSNKANMLPSTSLKACSVSHRPSRSGTTIKRIWPLSERIRSRSNQAGPAEWDTRLACLGRSPSGVSHNHQSASRRSSAMDLEFCDA